MKRNKIILIIVLAVAVLACGAVSWLLIKSIRDKSAAKEQRDSDFAALTKIYKNKVFPSPENIERVKADQKDLEEWLGSISEQLHKGDFPEVKLTSATFKQRLQGTVRELSKQPGIKNGKVVSADFHFGFDQYLGESNKLPKPGDVPRMTIQLDMIDQVCKQLFDAKILSLDAIQREAFDSVAVAEQPQQSRAPSRRRRRPSNKNRQRNAPQRTTVANQVQIPDGLVTKEEFTFEFTATPEAFVAALNELSSMDLFVVIAECSFAKTGDQLEKMVQKPKTGVDGVAVKKLSDMDRYERTITDPASDPPVSVKLVLNVYSFKGV